ncbi:MAG: hypothetical protein WAV11_02520 [Minisyncoccia bacterium]
MNIFLHNNDGGFIKWIIIIIIAILILSYLGYDLKAMVESQQNKDNFSYVWGYVHAFWDKYCAAPFNWVWENIIVKIVWEKGIEKGVDLIQKDKFLDMNANGQNQVNSILPSTR